ncbi:MAG: hypothetical protein HYX48_01375 [Chlamydiales bacterium]|nr:hypothetical protein [Chlamydiales bacterium]
MHSNVDPTAPFTARPVANPYCEPVDLAPPLAPSFSPFSSSVEKSQLTQEEAPSTSLQEQLNLQMVPRLIKIFKLKEALQEARNPPNRLQNESGISIQAVKDELLEIEKDFQVAKGWIDTCLAQARRALEEARKSE